MRRSEMFALRINASERQMIEKLAHALQRSQSDAIRLLIHEAVSSLANAAMESGLAGCHKAPDVVGPMWLGDGNREDRS